MTHDHGTYARYTVGRCRCDDCRRANREYERVRVRRRLAEKYGTVEPVYVDAAEVRAHVHALMAAGMGYRLIGDTAGISYSIVSRLLRYDASRPGRRLHRDTAAKLLAVQPSIADGRLVSAEATGRKVRALVALGYSRADLARRIGVARCNFRYADMDASHLVTAGRRRELDALYRELSGTPGPSTRARKDAKLRGWLPPLAWDDIDTGLLADDQDDNVDCWTCVEVDHLAETAPWQDIANRVGITVASLEQHLRRHQSRHTASVSAAQRVAS